MNQRGLQASIHPAEAWKPVDYLPDSLLVATWLAAYTDLEVSNLRPIELVELADVQVQLNDLLTDLVGSACFVVAPPPKTDRGRQKKKSLTEDLQIAQQTRVAQGLSERDFGGPAH